VRVHIIAQHDLCFQLRSLAENYIIEYLV